MSSIHELLFDWNAPTQVDLSWVEIQDDSLRDGLQGAFARKPSLAEKIELITLSSQIGAQSVMLGFPGTSPQEHDECRALLEAIEGGELGVEPRLMGLADPAGIEPLISLQKSTRLPIRADLFISASPIRRYVENNDLHEMLVRLEQVGRLMSESGVSYGISIKDATRTPPDALRSIIDVTIDGGARSISICDTVGICTPEGVKSIIQFTLDVIRDRGAHIDILWHGHNDRGFALANAVAAAHAGARIIGGSFLGIGERTGNTALEQFIMYMYQSGVTKYRIDLLQEYCDKLSRYTKTPIAESMPLVGSQAFATCSEVYVDALVKAKELGIPYEDHVFSAIPASELGRVPTILIGPASGRTNARYLLECLGIAASEDHVDELLALARERDRWLRNEEIREHFAGRQPGADDRLNDSSG